MNGATKLYAIPIHTFHNQSFTDHCDQLNQWVHDNSLHIGAETQVIIMITYYPSTTGDCTRLSALIIDVQYTHWLVCQHMDTLSFYLPKSTVPLTIGIVAVQVQEPYAATPTTRLTTQVKVYLNEHQMLLQWGIGALLRS